MHTKGEKIRKKPAQWQRLRPGLADTRRRVTQSSRGHSVRGTGHLLRQRARGTPALPSGSHRPPAQRLGPGCTCCPPSPALHDPMGNPRGRAREPGSPLDAWSLWSGLGCAGQRQSSSQGPGQIRTNKRPVRVTAAFLLVWVLVCNRLGKAAETRPALRQTPRHPDPSSDKQCWLRTSLN